MFMGVTALMSAAHAQDTNSTPRRFHLGRAEQSAPVTTHALRSAAAKSTSAVPVDPWQATNGTSVYQMTDAEQTDADRLAKRMVANMTLEEKVAYLGTDHFGAIDRFQLPQLTTAEGVDGVGATVKPSVVYSSAVSLAASWDPSLAAERGRQLALDAQAGGVQLVNGPGLNMYRTPYGGREAEYLSGEDPILGAVLGTSFVEGQQSQGVMSELKHTYANDQESHRTAIDETVDERTLREIYQIPYEAVVKLAHPSAIMCAFTAINGTHACEDRAFNRKTVMNQWGFDGFFQSDWGAIYDVPKAIKAGTSIDSSAGYAYSLDAIQSAISAGSITEADIDRLVLPLFRQLLYFKMGSNVGTPDTRDEPDRAEGAAVSTDAAEKGMVLLKNADDNLPLAHTTRRIAVLGAFANLPPPRPTGSGWVPYRHYVSELDGLKAAAPAGTQIDYFPENSLDPGNAATVSGWTGYYFSSPTWQGEPGTIRHDDHIDFDWQDTAEPGCATGTCGSVVWTAQINPTITGDYVFKAHGNGDLQIVVDGAMIAKSDPNVTTGSGGLGFHQPAVGRIAMEAGHVYNVTVTYSYESQWVNFLGGVQGVQFSYASLTPSPKLKDYDQVIVSGGVGGEWEGEGTDHEFALPEYQDELIRDTAALNPHTTAIVYASSAVDMRKFRTKVASLLYAWYPGQNGGTAVANILYGNANPSGKLPITLDKVDTDNVATENFPRPMNHDTTSGTLSLDYAEGPYFGYRGYDRLGIKPMFPFGFGLSYTTFRYSKLKIGSSFIDGQPSVDVTFDVTNTGKVDGAEAAQVYVGALSPQVDRPQRELKGFQKQVIKAGDTKHYTVHLPQRAFAYFNAKSDSWNVDKGDYEINVGGSSDNIKLHATYTEKAKLQLSTVTSAPIFDPGFAH
jgi:beta-glucosidase